MFDKQKIIDMTQTIQEFLSAHKEIFILPDAWCGNILSLLKRLNVKVAGILTNAATDSIPPPIQTPIGQYPLVNFSTAVSLFSDKTGIIIFSAKQIPIPFCNTTFELGNSKIEIPSFALTNEEARAIYDRLTMIELLQQYHKDGLTISNIKDFAIGFGRGISTFIDSRHQDIKIQVWDRREFKIPAYNDDDTAIVIQGPIQYLDNYTITTAQLYREWYPRAPIVISTWKNEATKDFLEECRKLNVVVLENDYPPHYVGYTTNLQLESSFQGVNYVKQNNLAKYTLKCRTDQRINRTDFIIYFKNLLKAFPPNGEKLKQRLLFFGACKWSPFTVCDFLYFGMTDDVIKLFDIPKQTEEDGRFAKRIGTRMLQVFRKMVKNALLPILDIKNSRKLKNYNILQNRWNAPECYIFKTFYTTHIDTIEPSKLLQTYWKFLRDYAIVVAQSDVILNWPKYTHYNWDMHTLRSAYLLAFYYDRRGIEFSEWLNIYLNYKDEDEN